MKKITAFAMVAVLLIGGMLFNQPQVQAESMPKETTDYMKLSGKITEVVTGKEKVTLTVETEGKEITFFTVTDDALLFNSGTTEAVKKESFEKGQQIDAYYGKNKPMLAIYPPQITADLVIVNDAEKFGSVKVGKFDSEFLSLDQELKLNLGKETVLVNEKGEKIEQADLSGKELVVFYTITTMSLPPQTPPNKVIALNTSTEQVEQNDFTNYMNFSGEVTEVVTEKDQVTLTVQTADKEPQVMILPIADETKIFNSGTTKSLKKDSFKKGQKIDAYYAKNKPMLLIYPPRVTPEFVIVHDEKVFGNVKVGKFNKKFLSLDNSLKLSIGKNTILLDENGKKVSLKDLQEKELIVFYTASTRSIPAITIPTKIIGIDELDAVQTIIENDHFMTNGTMMIPFSEVAEELGYEVKTDQANNTTLATLGNSSITITHGQKAYGYNRSLRQFAEVPVWKDDKLYVSADILELLNQ
ncbi:stalk domain-containing protein [Psychrobacillus sp.]|uniref:stalk domain-containing protein n=1 Tax=Psychrobacillus sp. TaxID=1871623 RepID=UPI0028BF2C39|nr:stalk domain-containing protein [Psychrobacillus sp.]